MSTPDEAVDVDTVADALGEMLIGLPRDVLMLLGRAVLRVLYDHGWRKHNDPKVQEPPTHMLRRWALYDAFDGEYPEMLAARCGLPGISPDVQEMERRASAKRLERLAGLSAMVDDHAEFFAGVFIGVQHDQCAADPNAPDIPDSYWNEAAEQMKSMLTTCCMSLLSSLHGLDVVQEGRGEVLHGI